MNVLIDIGHPAHVHLFRNAAKAWRERGDKVIFAIRDRRIIRDLLTGYGFTYEIASTPRTGFVGLTWEMLEHDWHVLRLALKHRIDVMLGTSVAIAHVSRVTRAKSIVFNEDDADYVKLFATAAYPFADAIVTPRVLRDKKTRKYICHDSYHELAYLHPNNFQPDPKVLDRLGVKEGETFFILRLVSFKAHHDVGQAGIDGALRKRLIDFLNARGKVFLTMEGDVPDDLRPYQLTIPPHEIHHAMHYATMLVSDSQTMTMEAAILGTPAVRYNTFVGQCSVISELEDRYQLALGFKPGSEREFLEAIERLVDDPATPKIWQERRAKMLSEKIDLNKWMLDLVDTKFAPARTLPSASKASAKSLI